MRRVLFVLLAVTCVLVATVAVAAPKKSAVSVADDTVTEPSGSPLTAVVDVSLSRKARKALKLSVETRDGTATAGSDYQPFARKVRIKKGRKSGRVAVTILPDETPEGDETFDVVVTKVKPKRRARLVDAEATVTIAANDGGAPTPTPSPSPTPTPCEHGTQETAEDYTGQASYYTKVTGAVEPGCVRWVRTRLYDDTEFKVTTTAENTVQTRVWFNTEDTNQEPFVWVGTYSEHYPYGYALIAIDAPGASSAQGFVLEVDQFFPD